MLEQNQRYTPSLLPHIHSKASDGKTLFLDHRTLLRVLAEEQSVRAREHETTQTGVGKEEKFEEHGEPVRGGTHDRRRTEERGRRERVKPKKRTSSKPPKVSRNEEEKRDT